MKPFIQTAFILISLFTFFSSQMVTAQTESFKTIQVNAGDKHQTITGFGASLAYYENWLSAHPNKAEIYNVIFGELSLDILRFRNAHEYDPTMIGRVKQFVAGAEKSLGHPIDVLVTSWGPPARLKSNNDKNNGGTLKYTVVNGKVEFDYSDFAGWWSKSLDEYNSNGIYPKYISIQNEPDWKASYESCLLRPTETVNSSDTLAGYNKALDAVYDTVMQRLNPPVFLGPECIGIGYNAVENYINALDLKKLYGIGHHLYHGAEGGTVANDPFTSSNYQKVGNFHPEVPHFQTEYSRADWFSVAGMMFQSLAVENVTAFLYWDLIWSEGGLVNLEFPWDKSRWTTSKGFYRTKDFYVFKHFSSFIHPGWTRIGTSSITEQLKTAAFLSSSNDTATFVVINRSATDSVNIRLQIPGFIINEAFAYSTTEDENFASANYLKDTLLHIPPKSVNTIDLRLSKVNTAMEENRLFSDKTLFEVSNSPNPFSVSTRINFVSEENADFNFEIYDFTGKQVYNRQIGFYPAGKHDFTFYRNGLNPGVYIYRLLNSAGKKGSGRFVIAD